MRLLKELSNEPTIAVFPSSAIKRILIVETESIAAKVLQHFFEQTGCLVDCVIDADSVLKQANNKKISDDFLLAFQEPH